MPSPGSLFIRYWAQTDNSMIGLAARRWLEAMVAIPNNGIRVLPTNQQGFMGDWTAHIGLGMVAIDGPYVNVVCCPPQRWAWRLSIRIPPSRDGSRPAETTSGDVEIYTAGHRNILIVPPGVYPASKLEVFSAMKYQALVCGSEADAQWWRGVGAKPITMAIPQGPGRADGVALLRKILFPGDS